MMGTPPTQEDCCPLDSHKDVRFNEKSETGTRVQSLMGPLHDLPTSLEKRYSQTSIPFSTTRRYPYPQLHQPQEESWAGKAILSLDGGGVRGYSSLLILQELMGLIAKLERSADPVGNSSLCSPFVPSLQDKGLDPMSSDIKLTSRYLPCHYFDYVSGTSTGGLVAIILGRLRWNIDDCIKEYERLSAMVFQKPVAQRSSINKNEEERWGHLKNEFNMLRPIWPSPSENRKDPVLFKSDPVRCRTIVCSLESALDDALTRLNFSSILRSG